MGNQVSFLSKAFLTDATNVGPVARVRSFMSSQVASFSKALLTDATHMGPLASVQSFMGNQGISFGKALLTHAAHVRLLTSVYPHVGVQSGFLREDSSANSADVGYPSGRHFDMSGLLVALLRGQATGKLLFKLDLLAVIGKIPCVSRWWVRNKPCQNTSS